MQYRNIEEDYEIYGNAIAIGGFGAVRLGIKKNVIWNQKMWKAIKHMYIKEQNLKYFNIELNIYPTFTHPNILKVEHVYNNKNDYWLVMPNLNTTLKEYIVEQKDNLDINLIKKWTKQLLSAINYCQQKAVVHCDIKPDNLLIDDQGDIQLIDFGSAKQCTTSIVFTGDKEHFTTLTYSAPEILAECRSYDCKIDVWAVGCILFELFTKYPLFQNTPYDSTFDVLDTIFFYLGTPTEHWVEYSETKISKCFKEPYQPRLDLIKSRISDHTASDLLFRLLEINPKDRISSEQALEHNFFN